MHISQCACRTSHASKQKHAETVKIVIGYLSEHIKYFIHNREINIRL